MRMFNLWLRRRRDRDIVFSQHPFLSSLSIWRRKSGCIPAAMAAIRKIKLKGRRDAHIYFTRTIAPSSLLFLFLHRAAVHGAGGMLQPKLPVADSLKSC